MKGPRMYTTPDEMAVIRRRLNEHDWYARAFANLRKASDEFLQRGIHIPTVKGFVFYETCPKDNTPLYQGPFEPENIYCPKCGTRYDEEPYRRAWVWFFQLYLAQRCREMGIIYQVTKDAAYANAVRYVLRFYAEHYEGYPLVDNVLGPTRLFQSTYQEALWVEALAGAADFVRETIPDDEFRFLRDRLFIPSAVVVKDYDEKENNRQVMNNGGIFAAGMLCEEDRLVHHAIYGEHGWFFHLAKKVGEDGLWYEGDNYHFASLPSMTNMADAMRRSGVDLFGARSGDRAFKQMYDAPMLGLYPDLTFPARKDSAFGSNAALRWYAGLYELAFNRYRDPAYGRFLTAMYGQPEPGGPYLCASGAIDVERQTWARRVRLDWRGFLNAVTDLPEGGGLPVRTSVNMPGTGLGVLRQAGGETYASLDYGHYGGGHGHPDRLNLNFYARGKRWFVDWGTCNYFLPELRWYRSTISHNTVTVDGKTHQMIDGCYRRFGVTPGAQVCSGAVDGVHPGVHMRRTAVLLSPDMLVDLFEVKSDGPRRLDWALHPYGAVSVEGTDTGLAPAEVSGENYEWLRNVHSAPAAGSWRASFRHDGDELGVHFIGEQGTEVFTAKAFGAPDRMPELFPVLIARRQAAATTFAVLYEYRAGGEPLVSSFTRDEDGAYVVTRTDGSRCRLTYSSADAAVSAVRLDPAGTLVEASGFGVREVPGAFTADFALEQAHLRVRGEEAALTVPERFGRLQLHPPAARRVRVNGGPSLPVQGTVAQVPAVWVSLADASLFTGVPNALTARVYNYTQTSLQGDLGLGLPDGWTLDGPIPRVDLPPESSGAFPLRVVPGDKAGALTFGLTGDTLELKPTAPVALEAWLPNLAGASLRAQVANLTGARRTVRVTAPGYEAVREVDGVEVLEFPVDWTAAGSVLSVAAECGGFVARQEVRLTVARPGREYVMDRSDMVRRAERHWQGPADLSARFRIDLDGSMLKLNIQVTDDKVKCSGSAEAYFDFDSVQVYFDPRPDRDRKNTYLEGVYGLVLVPASADGEPARVYPIGPVIATQVSRGMALPALEGVHLRSALRSDGYDLDLSLPLARLGCDPKPGDKLGFDIIINDNDGTYRRSLQMVWTGSDGARVWLRQDYHAPQRFGALVF